MTVQPDYVSFTGALRRNAGKTPLELVPPSLERAVANVLGKGSEKYAPRNWEKGMPFSVTYASLRRHCLAFWEGEDIDAESGQHHMAHVATNAAFLIEYARRIASGSLPENLDDRPERTLASTKQFARPKSEYDAIEYGRVLWWEFGTNNAPGCSSSAPEWATHWTTIERPEFQ